MESSISVIICCYNSAMRLPDTLRFMSNQQVSKEVVWELIIVDNNSVDNTSEIAINEWRRRGSSVPLSVIKESKPGLAHARATGIKQAKYDLLLFCDDDNWLESDYIEQACTIMRSNSAIGILGGLNTPVSSIQLPEWFGYFESSYACGPQANEDGEVSKDRLYITGAGMVIKREVFLSLNHIGFKSKLTDRKGEELSSGGDTELCFVAALLGYKIVYSSKLKLFHFMEAKRLTSEYLLKLMIGHAKSSYILSYYKDIYSGHSINKEWSRFFKNKSRELLHKYGLISFIKYSFGLYDKDIKGNIKIVWDFESLKNHLKMMPNYSKLVIHFNDFEHSIKSLHH